MSNRQVPRRYGNGRLARELMLSVSVVVGFAGTAHAQTAAPSSPDQQQGTTSADTGGEIVVTGYRESIEESLRQKREANALVDVITAEDIGKFPDKNVADALQRVPGVVITRDGGEGSRVSIRGLQPGLTLTLLNGNFLAGADSGDPQRSFNYVMLPSNFIASTEVYKSPEARLEEGGVGGTIILNTRRPLDLDAWSGFASVEGTYSDTTEKFEPQLAAQVSWKNDAETLGFLVGGVYQERSNRELRGYTETWRWWSDRDDDGNIITPATDVNGNPFANDDAISYWPGQGVTTRDGEHYSGYWAPQSVNTEVFDQKRERYGIQATMQVRPFDNVTVTSNYFRFEYSSDFVSNVLKIPEWGYGNFFTGPTFDPSGTIFQSAAFEVPPAGMECLANTPPCTMETPQLAGTYSREKQVSNTFETEVAYEGDRFEAVAKFGKTRATGGPSMRFGVAAKPRLTTTGAEQNGNFYSAWDFTGGDLNMEFSPELQENIKNGIAQIDIGSTGSGFTNSELEQRYAQLDMTRHFDNFLSSIQVGAKWRELNIQRETGRNEWYADPATELRYQDTPEGAIARPEYFYDQPMGNITGGFDANLFPGIDFNRYLDYINSTYGPSVRVPEPNNLYNITERVWAGYVQANFETGGLRGNIGLRVANTKQSGVTSDRLEYLNDYCVDGPGGPFDPNKPLGPDGNCDVIPLEERREIINTRVEESKNYTDWLPSLNLVYEVTDTLLVRGAVAKVIARPAFGDLAGSRSLTYRSAAYAFDRNEFGEFEGWSGGGGNAELKPFSAWQYDLGVEWYFRPGSVVGATVFRKDVSDFIVPLVLDVEREVAGEVVLIQPYSTVANGSDAVSQGVEVYAQHTLPFGLGAQVNFTYNDTSVADITLDGEKVGESALVGSSKTQLNASVFYETDRLLLRASYNRRGEVVGGLASGLNVYTDPYEQIDLNASYELFDNLLLTAAVINLTKSEESMHLGNDTDDRFYRNNYFGRRAYIGLSYNF
ncbi:TonB-dependent receptor [Pelagerythrobacter rhizovicinus]|uniref:TonB-dependent receptor n=1 Tax=Pelagerythrobacter rhizovicinus TaxID=2268576 RepID=A0A4Q2KN93_9SPHN|nr:TonB-dependent receptor [Pelagerythrobacter rhizovicinus]RXZ64661.1 TonB-dependent receptor [Pelagerythrobacter rhizovicinus]